MSYLTEKNFDFRSYALPADAFGVVHFKGVEGFSRPYEFEITLVSGDHEIDLTKVLQNPAVFTILRKEGDIPFNGILARFDQMQAVDDYVFYRAVLVPRFWWLSLTHHNQVFLDKTVPEIIGEVLQDGGLGNGEFDFRLRNDWPKWEYVCQYRESHLDFVSRWMEREGMYYYFEQTPDGEKLIITDTSLAHTEMAEGKTMYYAPPSGLTEPYREEVIHALVCKQKLLPHKLHVNDYNDQTPSLNLSAEADVLDSGRGEVHLYGEHFRTQEEGRGLARIRAEELRSHERRFHGESTIPYLRSGYLFELQDHYRESFNQPYLTIELAHEGSQSGFLISGIQKGLAEVEKQPYYHNSLVAIPADVQYRHPKTTEKPLFNGTINARIDAEGSGQYAELDSQGRYKVRLPFDINDDHQKGKASHWLRMAQPYAGENQGMHFPLHKNTEVLLTFVEGDPDRPIIAAAVPNPESPSPVSSANHTKSVITTGKGPKTYSVGAEYARENITIDQEGHITQLGTQVNADNYVEFEDANGDEHIRINSKGDLWLEANDRYGDYHVGQPDTTATGAGTNDPPKIGDMLDKFGTGNAYNPTGLLSRHGTTPSVYNFQKAFEEGHVHVSSFDTINTQEGNVYDFGGYWVYNLGNCYIEDHLAQKAPDAIVTPPAATQDEIDEIADKNAKNARLAVLNENLGDDLLGQGGPGWTGWKTIRGITTHPLGQKGSKNELRETADPKWNQKHPSSENWQNIWVEKKFGDAYEYREGNTVSVTKGSTQEIKISARSIEEKYSGDKKTYRMKSGGGVKEEKKWNRYTGYLMSKENTTEEALSLHSVVTKYDRIKPGWVVSHSDTTDTGHQVFSFNFSAANKTHADFSFNTEQYFKFTGADTLGLNINVASKQEISINVSVVPELDFKAIAGSGFKFDFGASAYWGLKAHLGGTNLLNLVTGEYEGGWLKTKLQKNADLIAKKEGLVLSSLTTALEKNNGKISMNDLKVEKSHLEAFFGMLIQGI